MKKLVLFSAALALASLAANAQTPTRVGVTGVSEVNTFFTEKMYDGTTTLPMAPGATITLTGVNPGDDVTAVPVGNYASANADSNINYSISFTLTGTDAANYYIDTVVTGNNGRITRKPLTISGTVIDSSKVYDGTTACNITSNGSVYGIVPGEIFFFNPTAAYADSRVGENKPVRVTYSLIGASLDNYIVPAADSTSFFAAITPKPVHITGAAIDAAKIYDGTTFSQVINNGMCVTMEIVLHDTVSPTASANYASPAVGTAIPVEVTYTLSGPQAANYTAIPDTLSANILQRPLTMGGAVVKLCKEYDGTTAATLVTAAEPTNLVAGDVVPVRTTAEYDTPDTGYGKTIFLTFAFADNGTDQLNYTLPDTVIYSHAGKIILPTQLDENGLYIVTDGTCEGDNIAVNYTIAQGEPVVYYITFPAEALALGFTNVDSLALPSSTTGSIPIQIPVGCPFGHYTCTVTFLNEAGGRAAFPFNFTVNYSSDYMTDIFEDVVSIVNLGGIFETYQWYHNGVAIDGATKPYYQEEGGLTGTYYVVVNAGTVTEGRTCEKAFNNAAAKSVKVSPNPVTTTANVSLHGFGEGEHLLVVYNAYGQQLLSRTFSGNESTLDLSALPQGTYLLTVDGEKAKTVKF